MARAIVVAEGVRIPGAAIAFQATRSSGPGGQNVNKVASAVELRIDLERIEGLPAAAHARLRGLAGRRLDAEGRLLVTSQRTRDQARNLEDAREKVRGLVAAALVAPRQRRKTRPTAGSRQDRLRTKRHRGETKRGRGQVGRSDD